MNSEELYVHTTITCIGLFLGVFAVYLIYLLKGNVYSYDKEKKETWIEPDLQHAERENDLIVCPQCGSLQQATIVDTAAGPQYLHQCTGCKFLIREKDWLTLKNSDR